MKTTRQRETDTENRDRATAILKMAKEKEIKKKLIPLYINDEDKTILLISPRMNPQKREQLREKMRTKLKQKRAVTIEKDMWD